jgi:hypothetical protein
MKHKLSFIILLSFFINPIDTICSLSFDMSFNLECDDWYFNNCIFTMTELKIKPLDTSRLAATDFAFLSAALLGKQVGRQYAILNNKQRIDFLKKQEQKYLHALRIARLHSQKKQLEQQLKQQQEATYREQLKKDAEQINNDIKRKLEKFL